MKKILLSCALAAVVGFSLASPVLAAGSKKDQGSSTVGTPTFTLDEEYSDVNPEDVDVSIFDESSLNENQKWDNVESKLVTLLEDFNEGVYNYEEFVAKAKEMGLDSSMETLLQDANIDTAGLEVADVSLLSGFQDFVMYKKGTTKQVHGTNITTTIKNAKVNDLQKDKKLLVLHYNTVEKKFELLEAKNIDYEANTFEVTFPNLSPVALVSIPKKDRTVETAVKSVNPMPFVALGAVAVIGLGFLAIKKKHN